MVLTLALTTDGARVAAQGMKPLLVQIMNTAAEPVPVVSSVDRVLLREQLAPTGICPTATHEVQRVLPDGTFGGSFIVPPGKKLVLTDLEAIIRAQPALAFPLGGVARIDAFTGPTTLSRVISAQGQVNADAVFAGVIPVSEHLQTGGVIGSDLPVCLEEYVLISNGGHAAELQEARLHGYLIDQ
ncbi:hypothetical protein [Luteitalea pratensis]|uniref:hypothetical protein n=1 Tax=Luteitalea pratensis TaxID=1855912 RepID=UPI0012FF7BB7|nr:hypothetical protein [Luteitalea pratensis]